MLNVTTNCQNVLSENDSTLQVCIVGWYYVIVFISGTVYFSVGARLGW